MKKNIHNLLNFLKKRGKSISPLLILTHNHPDPDALASAFALHYLAKKVYGIESKIIYVGLLGRMENRAMVDILKIPATRLKSFELKEGDHVALVDTQPAFKNNPFPEDIKATLVIDQHPSVTKPKAELAIIDEECGATSVILAQGLLQHKVKIPVNLATALAYGILSDTTHFFRCSDPEVIQTYLAILPYCDLTLLAKIQNPPRSKKFFTTLGKALLHSVVFHDIVAAHLGNVETPDLVAQTADFLLSYEKAAWTLCTGRYRGALYVSLRGSDSITPAYKVLRDIVPHKYQAGGHDVIAGGSYEIKKEVGKIPWVKAEKALIERFKKRLKLSKVKSIRDPFDLKRKPLRKQASSC